MNIPVYTWKYLFMIKTGKKIIYSENNYVTMGHIDSEVIQSLYNIFSYILRHSR